MKKHLLASTIFVLLFVLSGCGNQFDYNPNWKVYSNSRSEWEVNQDHYIEDSDTRFQWTLYTATKSRTPDFTYWTTKTSWKQISKEQAKQQLGVMWKLVPSGDFHFYELSTPSTAWVMTPATMVGVNTSEKDLKNNKRLVRDIMYRASPDAPIFLTTVPLQLTSIKTNQGEQSITYTFAPLS